MIILLVGVAENRIGQRLCVKQWYGLKSPFTRHLLNSGDIFGAWVPLIGLASKEETTLKDMTTSNSISLCTGQPEFPTDHLKLCEYSLCWCSLIWL